MIDTTKHRPINWRLIGWGAAAALLLAPAIAMRFTSEVQWGPLDFIVMGVLIGTIGLMFELFARHSSRAAYRLGSGLMLLGSFLLIWINLAVGIIGSENNDANWMFAGVLATLAGGAAISRLRAPGMKRTLFAAAAVQVLVGAVAVLGRLGADESAIWPRPIIVLSGFFALLWIIAGAMFGKDARD